MSAEHEEVPPVRDALVVQCGPNVHVQSVSAGVEGRTELRVLITGPNRWRFRLVAEPIE